MDEIFEPKHLKEVLGYALLSPCIRRKYGALIVDESRNFVAIGTNYRLGKYCNDSICVRDYCKVPHGENVELGGEIHAEQAALIDYHPTTSMRDHFLLAGWNHEGKRLDGVENYPCHVCAMMIKFAGFHTVWMPFGDTIKPVSIDEILEFYERRDS